MDCLVVSKTSRDQWGNQIGWWFSSLLCLYSYELYRAYSICFQFLWNSGTAGKVRTRYVLGTYQTVHPYKVWYFPGKGRVFPYKNPTKVRTLGNFWQPQKIEKKNAFVVVSSQLISTFKAKKIESVKISKVGIDMDTSMIIYVVFSLSLIISQSPQPFQIRFLTRPRLSFSHWLNPACKWCAIRGPSGRYHPRGIHAQSSRRGTRTCLRLRKSVNPLKN